MMPNFKNKKKNNNNYNNLLQGSQHVHRCLKQILPARAGNVMLGLEDILVPSIYQRNDISLYSSLQEAIIEMLLDVHLDKHSFFALWFM